MIVTTFFSTPTGEDRSLLSLLTRLPKPKTQVSSEDSSSVVLLWSGRSLYKPLFGYFLSSLPRPLPSLSWVWYYVQSVNTFSPLCLLNPSFPESNVTSKFFQNRSELFDPTRVWFYRSVSLRHRSPLPDPYDGSKVSQKPTVEGHLLHRSHTCVIT